MFLLSMLIRNVELMAMSFVVFSAEGHVDMWSTNKIIRYFCLFWFASSLLTCILTRWLLAVLISRILPSTSVGYSLQYTHIRGIVVGLSAIGAILLGRITLMWINALSLFTSVVSVGCFRLMSIPLKQSFYLVLSLVPPNHDQTETNPSFWRKTKCVYSQVYRHRLSHVVTSGPGIKGTNSIM